jgi:hypothetical protein
MEAGSLELNRQCGLVGAFEKPRPQLAMDFDGATNNGLRYFVNLIHLIPEMILKQAAA